MLHTYRQRGGCQLLGASDDDVAIGGVNRGVLIAMENDRGNAAPVTFGTRDVSGSVDGRWLPHGVERGGHIAGDTRRKAGMHADRGEEIGISGPHDGSGRTARRKAGDVDALRVDRVVTHDLIGDAGNQRGLAMAAALVVRAEPVPAPERVGEGGLRRVSDETGVLFGKRIHARGGGEVVGRLPTAMQHDHQRDRVPMAIAAWDVELVGACTRFVVERSHHELCAVRRDVVMRHRRWHGVSSPEQATQCPGC